MNEIGKNTTIMRKDKFVTPVRLLVENSSACQKSEEQFKVDRASLRACNYLHKKHKLQKKSEKCQRQAQKLMLKAANMKLFRDSELKFDDRIEMMLQLRKQRDILKTMLNELFRKSGEIEKEGKGMYKHLSELHTWRKAFLVSREKFKEVLMQAENSLEVFLDDTCLEKRSWKEIEMNIEYHYLLRMISNLRLQITKMDTELKSIMNKINDVAHSHVTRSRRKMEIEKQKLCVIRKMVDVVRKIFQLGMFQFKRKKLKDRAANFDFLAEAFLKQQSAFHAKVSSLNDYQGVQHDAFQGQIKHFSWKIQGLTKNTGQPYKKAVYQEWHLSDLFEIPMESWIVSSKEMVKQKHCENSQRKWNIESYYEATDVQKIVNYGRQKRWRVSGNTVHRDCSPHTKKLATTDVNNISVEQLKI